VPVTRKQNSTVIKKLVMVQFDGSHFEIIKFGMSHVGGHTDSRCGSNLFSPPYYIDSIICCRVDQATPQQFPAPLVKQ
jgi:hypothetical protein